MTQPPSSSKLTGLYLQAKAEHGATDGEGEESVDDFDK